MFIFKTFSITDPVRLSFCEFSPSFDTVIINTIQREKKKHIWFVFVYLIRCEFVLICNIF